ncbi:MULTISPECIES: acetyl-CoA carboxylase carboxyltransferase subunit alpha [Thermoactinomyces]|jgi:acetyl-CoA carboxylase carboxyl transferase subunit alpha|uniref:Acetyl-coenzyme A carboxylase carboxyl transferase subunit alpha n=1 Tax=Thermoactinomyces daqus TaxID=1329516 RepID=A0A7W2AHD2_9BACL|nr:MULTISPECIES: acetyl-CoA carboxylase carboxyltransferase subunit alpha [Thermoactinomyces]MBA4541589.1 acetyl-CoA carboxylase carboxyltransferase subunit alpha [Thermoactinomyces daqus]MBH8597585.1 acetyl-CoA carboxylase carboxyltransferase subunit alpha [Thermoactinomyces sp. CICC 10523]MBH8603926.1 acetyl-CoA carboxylase carboxyltransferase subunit alpha [Thermoactinomyces sp. CICC 10522]MBH8606541.1 acetyl-CoA carboxylase carboxyltransferase subunit alpha [Thermoactinomyces sp. CICC 10521
MKNGYLDFEKPLVELRDKIAELKKFASEKQLDMSEEINTLEAKAQRLEDEIYGNLTVWQKVQIARQSSRPTTLHYIHTIFTDFIELHGDRLYGDDPAIVGGIAKFNGRPVTVIGHERGTDTKDKIARNFGLPHPEGYRKALRLMQQANKFGRPIICFIDTQGAHPGVEAEERGQSEAIARNLREMAGFTVPIICVVTGEGGSGGALGIGVGNRLLMLEHAYYSVISPEGAAAILWRDSAKAQEAAEALKITAGDLKELGVIDEIIPEPKGGAHKDPMLQSNYIKQALNEHLQSLLQLTPDELLEDRYKKYAGMGEFTSLVAK